MLSKSAVAALFVSAVLAQSQSDRTFHFTHGESDLQIQEIAMDLRGITDIQQVSLDLAQRTLTLHGTTAQIALAEWLVKQLDQPANPPATTAAPHQYRPSGAADDVVRVFFLTHAESPQSLQQIAVKVRTTTRVKRLFTYNEPKAMTLRGTAAQIALADRLINEWDR